MKAADYLHTAHGALTNAIMALLNSDDPEKHANKLRIARDTVGAVLRELETKPKGKHK